MPDDQSLTDLMAARGARPVTIRAPLYDPGTDTERMQRAAAYRQPSDHPEAPKIDQLHALWLRSPDEGGLNHRQYQNACAVLRLLRVVERSEGVAQWTRTIGRDGSLSAGPQDVWNKLIEHGGVGMQAVCMLLRDEALGPYMFGRAKDHLDTLDRMAMEWAGERWPEEGR